MVFIKNEKEIAGIKKACEIFMKVKEACMQQNFVGQSLKAIDEFTKNIIEANGAKCAFHGYQGFSGYNCMSKNEVIIHGIGTHDVTFGPEDKLTLDIGVNLNGYICDAAFSIFGPKVNPEYLKMSEVTLQAIYEACKVIKPNNTVGDISHAVQTYVTKHGYQLLKHYGGHGCGLKIHEDPIILNYGQPHTGYKLKPGMVICVEPMTLQLSDAVHLGKDN